MSALVAYRTAIASTLAADSRFAGVKIYTHGGDFDRFELKRYAKQTPAIVIAILKADAISSEGGVPICDVMVSAMVLTQDKPALPKDVGALVVVDLLLNILCRFPSQVWGLTNARAVKDARAMNCYTKEIDQEGVAIWAVAWRQGVELIPTVLATDAFEQFHANWDLTPRDNDAPISTASNPQPADAVREAEDDVLL